MAAIKEKTKPRLKNLDDLFNINDGVNPLETSTPIIETQANQKRVVNNIYEILKSACNLRDDKAFYNFMWAVANNVYKN